MESSFIKKYSFIVSFIFFFLKVNSQCNLLCNADFEDVNVTSPASFTFVASNVITCWQTSASDNVIEVWSSGFSSLSPPINAYSGNQYVELNANEVSTLFQSITVIPGATLSISFAHRGRQGVDVMNCSIGPSGGPYTNLGAFSDNNISWGYYTVSYVIPMGLGSNYTLLFTSASASGGDQAMGNFIDAISVSQISNPNQIQPINNLTICNGQSLIIEPVGANTYTLLPSNLTGTSFTLSPTSSTNYTVIALITNSCFSNITDTNSFRINVNPTPIANFNSNDLCYGETNIFTDNSTILSNTDSILNWSWNFGDTTLSNSKNPIHTYTNQSNRNNNTSYQVKLIVTSNSGCQDSITKPVTIYALPTANFTADSVCFNSASHLISIANGNGNPVTIHAWDFTNDNIADVTGPNTINYTMPLAGNNGVNYTVTSTPITGLTCKHDTGINVHTFPNPVADFTFLNRCINAQPNTFDASMSNTSVGTIVDYAWNFGNGQTDNSPLPTATNNYNLATMYNVTLTVSTNKGCLHAVTKQVEVFEKPLIAILSQPIVCLGSTTTFTAQTLPNSGNITNWLWDANNNLATVETNGQQSNYTFNTEGWQILNLMVSTDKGCKDTLTRNVYINYNPKPEFTVDDPDGCPEHCVTFNDQTPAITAPAQITQWNWDFGNGLTNSVLNNSQQNICYTNITSDSLAYYTVSLNAKTDSGCVATTTYSNMITVYPLPVANYTVVPEFGNVVVPLVHYISQSIDYTKWYWNFGDASAIDSTQVNPDHYYNSDNADTYYSWLIVANQYGCRDTANLPVVIKPDFVFYIPNAFSPNEDTINNVFTGTGIGIEKYDMWIFDRWGEQIYYTDDILKGWNGQKQGSNIDCKQDVYTWKVELKDVFNKKHNYVGHVTLLR